MPSPLSRRVDKLSRKMGEAKARGRLASWAAWFESIGYQPERAIASARLAVDAERISPLVYLPDGRVDIGPRLRAVFSAFGVEPDGAVASFVQRHRDAGGVVDTGAGRVICGPEELGDVLGA